MDRYAVVGHPVTHSRSPAIHQRFAEATAQVLSYDRLEAPLDAFASTVLTFAAQGGRGCNVTVPFKRQAWEMATVRTPRAERAGALNTLRFDAGGWWGDNTDGVGIVRDITVNAGVPIAGQRVLLIGAGGAAAGVVGPLLEAQPSALRIVNRTVARADDLVSRHADLALDHGVALDAAGLDAAGSDYDIVINGTASSLGGEGVPVALGTLRAGGLALDMMYGPAARPFIAWAQAQGGTGRDGLGMLVEQAAESFSAWRGVMPATAPVLAELRAVVDAL